MRLTEIRILSGPSAEIAGPAVRLTFAGPPLEEVDLPAIVSEVADRSGLPGVAAVQRRGADGTVFLTFPWARRGTGEALGRAVAEVVEEGPRRPLAERIARAAGAVLAAEPGEPPDLLDPAIPTIAVTGTNGKTTTTRLLGGIASAAGHTPAWSSTDGVFVAGRCIEAGDWSGPAGARLVLGAPEVSLAILETARGGLMQRGMGVSGIDVAVFTNVSADHLGLHGIDTVEDLAWAKSAVVRAVRPTGWAVLNAEDPLVRPCYAICRGRTWYFALDPNGEGARFARAHGQRLTTVRHGDVVVLPSLDGGPAGRPGEELVILPVADIPVTLAGLSQENVANVLAATSAALAIGLPLDAVRRGLAGFVPDTRANPGRMNIFSVPTDDGGSATVILDFAHNEAGARALLRVGAGLRPPGARLHVSIGNAGDRTDEGIAAVGRMAAEVADTIQLAAKPRYLRGRTQQEIDQLQVAGIRGAGREPTDILPDEVSGLTAMLRRCRDGDVVAMMVHEQRQPCLDLLQLHGAVADSPGDIARKVAAAG